MYIYASGKEFDFFLEENINYPDFYSEFFGVKETVAKCCLIKTVIFFSRLIVSGASGGESRRNRVQSKGDQIRALVQLEANETLFISVGQMGGNHAGVSQNFFKEALKRFFTLMGKFWFCTKRERL